jgi:CRP/FNR family transcriptional regulator, cyclic AMP receptor protein
MNSPYGLPTECRNWHLRSDSFFCSLSRESLESFNHIKDSTVFPEGTAIFVQGQTPRGIFLLCQGQAKLSTTSMMGKPSSCESPSREKSSAYTQLLQASPMS